MKHHLNKYTMLNDIILTISLSVSVCVVKLFMILTELHGTQHDFLIFCVLSFIMIKTLYFSLTRLSKNIRRKLY
jgi:hypothetical protein